MVENTEMKTILIVDDEERVRDIYRMAFSREGYRVLVAPNAVDAYELIRSAYLEKKTPIDIVLLDINMPEVTGDTFYESVQVFYQDIKIIVSSVYPVHEQRRRIHGACDYYDKAQGLNVLIKKVRAALQES